MKDKIINLIKCHLPITDLSKKAFELIKENKDLTEEDGLDVDDIYYINQLLKDYEKSDIETFYK